MEIAVEDGEDEEEERIQNLRSKATELLLREEYEDSIKAYSQIISLSLESISTTNPNHPRRRTLCLAFSNRAEARARLSEFSEALRDCEEALRIDGSHFKTLLCKGRILLSLNRYGAALDCFRKASLDPRAADNSDSVNGLLQRCKRLESLSRTGAFDVSDWVLAGFRGKIPELAEYVGAVEVRRSEISGRGLFATRNVESGALMLVTKAVAVDRAIMPIDSGENAHLVIWKNFIDKVAEAAEKCEHISYLISCLSAGGDDDTLEVPDIAVFQPEAELRTAANGGGGSLDKETLLNILDVNSVLEDAVSANVLGKNAGYQGVGLWILASFINHSCDPNVRRVHVGDHVIVHAARDLKIGEELTSAYFDVLSPWEKRREMAENWGFVCRCKRCAFEDNSCLKQETREMEMAMTKGAAEMGSLVYRLEEGMRRGMIRGKGKGYLRTSFWEAYAKVYGSEKMMRKWGRKIPTTENVVDSIVHAAGSDERVLRVFMEGLRRSGSNGVVEIEKVMKMGRGIYGKVMKKQAIGALIQTGGVHDFS